MYTDVNVRGGYLQGVVGGLYGGRPVGVQHVQVLVALPHPLERVSLDRLNCKHKAY